MKHCFAIVFLATASVSAGRPTTIISILSDDHGYFDLSSRGNINVTTPNLTSYSHGIDLSHHYSFKYCSPSRRSFVTGDGPCTWVNSTNKKMASTCASQL